MLHLELFFILLVSFVSYIISWTPILINDIDGYKFEEAPYSGLSDTQYNDIFIRESHNREDDVHAEKYRHSKAYRRPERCRSMMHDAYQPYSNYTMRMHDQSRIVYRACKRILERHNIAPDRLYEQLANVYLPKELCPYANRKYKCDPYSKYRTYDGSCNNLRKPWLGSTDTPMGRLQQAEYNDFMGERKYKSKTGKDLPNPRYVAHHLNRAMDKKIELNVMTVFYSQFIDHDLSLTALIPGHDGKPKACTCDTDDPDCINIPTPRGLSIDRDQKCMVSPRSLGTHARMDCKIGPREQINQLSHWLDLSQVYGVKVEDNHKLRTFRDGLLKVAFIKGIKYEQLPMADKKDATCKNSDGLSCFHIPEIRGNQNHHLLGMHTIHLREHNRIAKRLKSVNPRLNDEKLFQLARRINIAQYQHIVYKDWLPVIIGNDLTRMYDTSEKLQGFFYGYNPDLNPRIFNEFATAAFRFGHTLVFSWYSKLDRHMRVMSNISLETNLLKTSEAYKDGGLDAVFRASLYERSTEFDSHVTHVLNERLFINKDRKAETKKFSLPALNMNRNRDHGLPPYTTYRKMCGLNPSSSFDELDHIPRNVRKRLENMYDHVEDIELFIGGISERRVKGGAVGPTFASIIAEQFKQLKYGDRHYYENGHDERTRFSLEELNEIRKASFSRIICDNMDIDYLPENPWFVLSERNKAVKCDTLPSINLDVFKVY